MVGNKTLDMQFCLFGLEVKSTYLLITSELTMQHAQRALFTCVMYTIHFMSLKLSLNFPFALVLRILNLAFDLKC